jgi:hypothetical protein
MTPIARENESKAQPELCANGSSLEEDISKLHEMLLQGQNDLRRLRQLAARQSKEERECTIAEQRHISELKGLLNTEHGPVARLDG